MTTDEVKLYLKNWQDRLTKDRQDYIQTVRMEYQAHVLTRREAQDLMWNILDAMPGSARSYLD